MNRFPGGGGAFMDPKFLEFWAELLKGAARGQRRLDEASQWVGQGLSGSGDMADLFRRAYGLEGASEKSPGFDERWRQALEAFRESMKEYLSMFGVVPLTEHLERVAECEELRKKVALLEETIRQLEGLVESKWFGAEKYQGGLQDLVTVQTEQFRELMKRLGMLPEDPEL